MLVLIIMILPGIMAAVLQCKWNQKMHLKETAVSALTYIICINLLIFGGLWLVGIKNFNLFEVSLKFKLAWFLAGTMLAIVLVCFLYYYRKINWIKVKRILPVVLFLVITYTVYAPSSLFLENISEFDIRYITIAPVIFVPAVLLGTCIALIGYVLSEKYLIYYTSIIFGIGLSIYVQMNFLNPKFPPLDGAEIDWGLYSTEAIVSTVFWILCILIILAAAFYWKQKEERIIKYISIFLSSVQMVSLIVLLLMNKQPSDARYGFTKEGEFSIGSEENIIIFIVDCLQSARLEGYLTSDAYTDQLNDFTFFDNTVSGGAPTAVAVPLLLTGIEYDPMEDINEYRDEIWQETQLYDDMMNKGYDVRFYTTYSSLEGICDVVSNYKVASESWINDYVKFGKQFYKLVNLYTMPQFLKAEYWLSTDSITRIIANDEYVISNHDFYRDMEAAGGLATDFSKSFRLYHLAGVHWPWYSINEKGEEVEDHSKSIQEELQEVMAGIYSYIDMMKDIGAYDASTIIILGDHGEHLYENTEMNPAVLIKSPYESHELEHNSVPVHFRNVVATMAKTINEDYSSYGPSVYDITQESDVERLHTIRGEVGERIGIKEGNYYNFFRLRVIGDARVGEYEIWNPYEINRISYKMGDIIDYTNQNAYSEKLDYRLYKENGAAVASNELSICFELEDYQDDDLEFCFTYSDVYNNSQKMRFYANGNYLGNVICEQDTIGKKNVVTIPGESINKDEVVIRMVFPGAVTPNQIDRSNPDTRVLSVAFETMQLKGKSR